MNKRIEDAHQRVLVIPEKLEGDLATLAECPFNACHAERVHNIWGKAERDALWCFQRFALHSKAISCGENS